VLPPNVLDYLMSRGLPYDKFQLLNPQRRGFRLFTGPLDFCAAPGECYLPTWVMKQLGIKEGDICAVATAAFPACAFVKFQPHTSDFLDIADHYTVLTRTMENMGGLTQGSSIRVSDGKKTYTLDVLEVQGKLTDRDDSNGKGVAIGLFECPVEFAEPKDLMSKKKQEQQKEAMTKAAINASAGDVANEEEETGKRSVSAHERVGAKSGARRAATKSDQVAVGSTKSSGGGGVSDDAEATIAAPVPKFKRRKAAEAKGEVLEDKTSAYSGKAKTLGSSVGDESKKPTSELAKLRAAAKTAAAAKEAEELTASEAARVAALAARPLPVALAERILKLLRTIIETLVSLAHQLLLPSDVRFD